MQCLDFVNTVEPRNAPALRDALTDYNTLVDWSGLPAPDATRLKHAASADPAAAARAFRSAIALREALFDLFSTLAHGRPALPAAAETLRRHYVSACRSSTWDISAGRLVWAWPPDDLRRITWQLALDAADLAATPAPLKQCPGCGWLFLDRTKNHSRRWCSMSDCGNLTKSRRLSAKRKATRAATAN